jgi:competence protein ComEC
MAEDLNMEMIIAEADDVNVSPLSPLSEDQGVVLATINKKARYLLILHLDVGQGECTLVVERLGTENLWVAIIDGGYANAGRGSLSRYLQALEITSIDAVICTHFDGDHTKGLISFLDKHGYHDSADMKAGLFGIGAIHVRNNDEKDYKSQTKLELLKVANEKQYPVIALKEGNFIVYSKPFEQPSRNLQITCLYANPDNLSDENQGSLALLVTYGTFRYYTAGDLPLPEEQELLGKIGSIDAFKCGHHGSANSTPLELATRSDAKFAFISCGNQNYGHPTYDVLERLMHPESTVMSIFLTNCIHNRRGANLDYNEAEWDIARTIQGYIDETKYKTLLKPICCLEVEDGSIYHRGNINDNLTFMLAQDDAQPDYRLVKSLLKGALRAAEHEVCVIKEDHDVFVAGDSQTLGSIALFTPLCEEGPAEMYAGLYDCINQGSPQWIWKRSVSVELAKADISNLPDIQNRICNAVTAPLDEGEYEQSEKHEFELVKGVPSTPNTYQAYISSREDNYTLFSRPTIVGLHQGREAKPVIPFCCVCRYDLFADNPAMKEPLELLRIVSECDVDHQEDIFVHKSCFQAFFDETLRKNYTDKMFSVHDSRDIVEIHGTFDCPFCINFTHTPPEGYLGEDVWDEKYS